jgi:DNA-binding transcriptional LysR family regulator
MAALARVDHAADTGALGAPPATVSVDLLLFFTAVAEELSFTRAARRLGIDQSWLSHKIRQLETELSCTLFARTTRRIELTHAGLALLGPAQALARAAEEARRAAWAVSSGLQGTLRIGALPYSFWNPERVKLVDQFIADHPETDVDVSNGPSNVLLERLHRGEIDMAFVCWPFDPTGLEMMSIRLDHFCLLVPKGHPLEAKAEITLADVAGHRMAIPSEQHNPLSIKFLYWPFVEAGVVPATVAEFEGDAIFRLAERHKLLALCNVMEVDQHLGDCFVARPIAGHEAVSRKCLVRQKSHLTPAIDAFWSLAGTTYGTPFDAVAPV